jgi:hypothetical protein
MKKYELLIQIGYQRFKHKETCENEFDARTRTIELAMKKFSVKREDVKIVSCDIIGEKYPNSFNFDGLKNIFGIK